MPLLLLLLSRSCRRLLNAHGLALLLQLAPHVAAKVLPTLLVPAALLLLLLRVLLRLGGAHRLAHPAAQEQGGAGTS